MDNIAVFILIGVNALISYKGFEDNYFFNKKEDDYSKINIYSF